MLKLMEHMEFSLKKRQKAKAQRNRNVTLVTLSPHLPQQLFLIHAMQELQLDRGEVSPLMERAVTLSV